MPSTLDRLALRIAAGTLPPALPVRATDEEMVDGKAARYRKPTIKVPGMNAPRVLSQASHSSGNTTKVKACTIRCSRQFFKPWRICSLDRFMPCRKNTTNTPILVTRPACIAPPVAPKRGNSQASRTASTMPQRNQSVTTRLRCLKMCMKESPVRR